MEAIKIDKKVPLPDARNRHGALSNALRALKIGESFLVPDRYKASARQFAYIYQKKLNTKFAIRTTDQGLRIWRVK